MSSSRWYKPRSSKSRPANDPIRVPTHVAVLLVSVAAQPRLRLVSSAALLPPSAASFAAVADVIQHAFSPIGECLSLLLCVQVRSQLLTAQRARHGLSRSVLPIILSRLVPCRTLRSLTDNYFSQYVCEILTPSICVLETCTQYG